MLGRRFGRRKVPVDVRAECFRQFFESQLGRSSRTSTIQSDPSMPTIDIETYVAPWDRAVRVIASVGLSYYTRQRGDLAEVMLLVDAEHKVAASAFARIVGLLADEPLAFGLGEVYEGSRSFADRIAAREGRDGPGGPALRGASALPRGVRRRAGPRLRSRACLSGR